MMIALAWHDATARIDIQPAPEGTLTWLENAVTISLFTDALAGVDDEIPDGSQDRRGYWADTELPGTDVLGSKLWLLKREKITIDVIKKARDYCDDALRWLVKEEHLKNITVTAERAGIDRIGFDIKCQLPDGNWNALKRSWTNAL